MKLTPQQEQEIASIQQERKLTRKSAVQYWRRNQAKAASPETDNGLPPAQPTPVPVPAAPVAPKEAPAAVPEPKQFEGTVLDQRVVNPDAGTTATAKVAVKRQRKAKAAKTKADVPKGKPGRPSPVELDVNKVIKLYQQGTKVVDIAEAVGYKRATGQNRIRTALMAAGIYKGRTGKE